MKRFHTWRLLWHAALAIGRRDRHAALHSAGLYATQSVGLVVIAAALRRHVEYAQDNGLLVVAHPFAQALWGAAIVSCLYLAFTATTNMARERKEGTLHMLLYEPMDVVACLLGKYLAHMSLYAVMLAAYLIAFGLYAWVTNLPLDLSLLWAALLSTAPASAAVGSGMLLSRLNRPARIALLALLAALAAAVVGRPRQSEPAANGLSYHILLQDVRARPPRSHSPADVIYAPQGTAFYLQPYTPQTSRATDNRTWVLAQPLENAGHLILNFNGPVVEVLAQPYTLEPVPGPTRRYKVVDYDPATETRPPDFVAYPLFVDAHHAGYRLQLQDTAGRIVAGSQRQVRRVPQINGWALYSLAGLPLTVGGAMYIRRRELAARGDGCDTHRHTGAV